MDATEFQEANKNVAKFIVDYIENLSKESLLPKVRPGEIQKKIDLACPVEGMNFNEIFKKFQTDLQKGLIPWSSPHFHSQFAPGHSYETMIAELLTATLNMIGVNWEASPVATELEMLMTNWLAKMMKFPNKFLHSSKKLGGGVFQNTCTDATLLALLTARTRTIDHYSKQTNNSQSDLEYNTNKLVVYTSSKSHSSTKQAISIANLHLHELVPNELGKITAVALKAAFKSDLANGLTPCIFISTMGTDLGDYDDLEQLAPICKEYDVWLHVDASFYGSALIASELCPFGFSILEGIDSIVVIIDTVLPISFDTVAYWTSDRHPMEKSLNVNASYLKPTTNGQSFLNWQIGTGRKLKALKVWMVLKTFGASKIRQLAGDRIKLADYMKNKIKEDSRLKVTGGLPEVVNFCLNDEKFVKGTEKLLRKVNELGKISLGEFKTSNRFYIQFIVNQDTNSEHVDFAWKEIDKCLSQLK